MLLDEFDPSKTAVINPWDLIKEIDQIPKTAIACYSHITFERIVAELQAEIIAETSTANGKKPIYRAKYKGSELSLFMIDVGAPTSVGMLEDVYQMGVQTVVIFGTCGVLDGSIADCSIIIPNAAVRDEGTSYHYMPPSDEIRVSQKHMEMLTRLLDKMHVTYTVGKVWTTDAFYRETVEKVKRRKMQGCICVDMECSANAAVAQFRDRNLIQFFYAADNLDAEEWDIRSLHNCDKLEEKDRIAAIALEIALQSERWQKEGNSDKICL